MGYVHSSLSGTASRSSQYDLTMPSSTKWQCTQPRRLVSPFTNRPRWPGSRSALFHGSGCAALPASASLCPGCSSCSSSAPFIASTRPGIDIAAIAPSGARVP